MDPILVIVVFLLAVGVIVLSAYMLGLLPFGGEQSTQQQMQSIVSSQRFNEDGAPKKPALFEFLKQSKVEKVKSSKLTIERLLRYANWKIPVLMFHASEVVVSLVCFTFARAFFGIVLQIVALTFGPIFMRWLLMTAVDKRFKMFEKDYAPFLMSFVGLLKTGMNPVSALQASAEGLENSSMMRAELELMLERMRLGVSEDQSIGAFAEDIYHPEIELFVQALLLSRRVGGNLSDTLERLSKQVRKRQFFRESANAAVGLQRGSIMVIVAVLCALETYIVIAAPELIMGAVEDETGWQVLQAGLLFIIFGMWWVRQVTKIKI